MEYRPCTHLGLAGVNAFSMLQCERSERSIGMWQSHLPKFYCDRQRLSENPFIPDAIT